MKIVEKKILPEYFKEVRERRKTFEIRKDEDDIRVGDILVLKEWNGEKFTGHSISRSVSYVLRNATEFGLMKGYCVIAIQPTGWENGVYTQNEVMCALDMIRKWSR